MVIHLSIGSSFNHTSLMAFLGWSSVYYTFLCSAYSNKYHDGIGHLLYNMHQ